MWTWASEGSGRGSRERICKTKCRRSVVESLEICKRLLCLDVAMIAKMKSDAATNEFLDVNTV